MAALGFLTGWRHGWRGVAMFVLAGIAAVLILSVLALRDLHTSVSIEPWATQACRGGWHDDGPVTSVVLTSDAGPYPIFQVTCQDGLQLTVAH